MMRYLERFCRRVGRLRDESGQALIEFSAVLLMMILLIVALVDFARVFMQYQVVTDAAREGARRAVVYDDPPITANAITAVVLDALSVGGIDVSGATTTDQCAAPTASVSTVTVYSCNWNTTTTGEEVRVGIAVPYEFALLGPFIGWTTGQREITLRTSISMRNE
jgi:Flp pilus assembly protein TadG